MSDYPNKFISEKNVTEITGIALSTLRNHRSLGKGIPYAKVFRSVKYSLADVLQYMEAHKIQFNGESRLKNGRKI